jgi:hypothetical protein
VIICEKEIGWNSIDPQDPRIAAREVDIYGHTPRAGMGDHRLSVRRVLATGQFELYRHFLRPGPKGPAEQVVLTGTLAEVLARANSEWREEWRGAGVGPLDTVCDHDGHRATGCPGRETEP